MLLSAGMHALEVATAADIEIPTPHPPLDVSAIVRTEIARTFKRLTLVARTLTQSPADADDLLQATFLRALERAHLLQHQSNVASWLIRIMHNLNFDRLRHPGRQTSPIDDVELATPAAEEVSMWRLVDPEDVELIVATLSSETRDVWELVYVQQLGQREIADRMGIAASTVASRMSRARSAIREELLARRCRREDASDGECCQSVNDAQTTG